MPSEKLQPRGYNKEWDQLKSMLVELASNVVAVAEKIAALAANDPEFVDDFSAWSGVDRGVVSRLYRVGAHRLHPSLFLDMSPGGQALSRMRYETQVAMISQESVPVLTADGQTLQVGISNLTRSQVKQVFNGEVVRTLAQQRAWLASQAQAAPHLVVDIPPYEIVRGAVVFNRGVRMSRAELITVLARLG